MFFFGSGQEQRGEQRPPWHGMLLSLVEYRMSCNVEENKPADGVRLVYSQAWHMVLESLFFLTMGVEPGSFGIETSRSLVLVAFSIRFAHHIGFFSDVSAILQVSRSL